MKRAALHLLSAFCAGLALFAPRHSLAQSSQTRSEALPALIAEALNDPKIPAMGLLVIRHGVIAEQAVDGVRAAGKPDRVTREGRWHIGSDAKAMTATMVARLVERGVLSWTTPLSRLLPEVAMRPEYRDVTLVDLLSHRAGLRDLDDTGDAKMIAQAFADRRPLPTQRQDFARQVLNEPPIGSARAASAYSNSDYVLAGAIAERATGKTFEVLMQQEVFRPLGMKVDFQPYAGGEILGHKAGKPLVGLQADNPPLFAPAGAVRLTLRDWAAFAIDQMAGERGQGRLLAASTYVLLHKPQGDTAAALGWGVRTTWPKTAPIRMLTHAGSNGYSTALIALAPDQMGGVLVAANAGEGTEVEAVESTLLIKLMTGIVAGD